MFGGNMGPPQIAAIMPAPGGMQMGGMPGMAPMGGMQMGGGMPPMGGQQQQFNNNPFWEQILKKSLMSQDMIRTQYLKPIRPDYFFIHKAFQTLDFIIIIILFI